MMPVDAGWPRPARAKVKALITTSADRSPAVATAADENDSAIAK